MNLFVYAPEIKKGTMELIEALGAKRLNRFDGMRFTNKGKPTQFDPQDAIICWGACVPPIPGIKVFNSNLLYPNEKQLNMNLRGLRPYLPKGWTAYDLVPITEGASKADEYYYYDGNYGAVVLSKDYKGYCSIFSSKPADYRFTVFANKIIKAEVKIPTKLLYDPNKHTNYNPTKLAHYWYRTLETNWVYRDITETNVEYAENAKTIIDGLGLNFGIIYISGSSIGIRDTLTPIVRKIKLAPELDKDNVNQYTTLLKTWLGVE